MSRPLYYYAKLNENDICYGFESLGKKLNPCPSNMVYLPDYNETYLWKKYDRELKAFGQETYEPSIDAELQEKIEELETENSQLKEQVMELNNTINILNGSILELTQLIASLQSGGVE
ncbi:hypothetical protein [Tepidimicrobium xylanilyticum]